MNALLHFQNDEVRDMVTFSIEKTFRIRTLHSATDAGALELFKEESGIDCVISDGLTEDSEFFHFLANNHADLPCFVCTNVKQDELPVADKINVAAICSRHELLPKLHRSLVELFGSAIMLEDNTEFVRIATHLLRSVGTLKGDVFIRLSPKKHLKLFHGGDEFEQEDFDKYTTQKGVDYLYVKKDDAGEFMGKFAGRVAELLAKQENETLAQAAQKNEEVLELVGELIDGFGFTKEVQIITQATVDHSMEMMGTDPKLSKILANLQVNKNRYIASHSLMLAHISCAIAASLMWSSEKEYEKLTLSAMLHDITLKNNELAQMNTLADLEKCKDKFTKKEIQNFLKHPAEVAEFTKHFPAIPVDSQTILIQHHERPNGTGFPNGLRHNYIKSLSAVFIVAHDFVQFIVEKGKEATMPAFLKKTETKYAQGTFRKIWGSLHDMALGEDIEGNA